jgi:hypothetical protein
MRTMLDDVTTASHVYDLKNLTKSAKDLTGVKALFARQQTLSSIPPLLMKYVGAKLRSNTFAQFKPP